MQRDLARANAERSLRFTKRNCRYGVLDNAHRMYTSELRPYTSYGEACCEITCFHRLKADISAVLECGAAAITKRCKN